MTDPATSHDVVVVGAGIIGLCAAHKLQRAGRRVTLIDADGIARRTSAGNAGGFAFSDIMPLATRGMLAKVPGWLLDPLGPLSIPPAYFAQILPWLVRFWRAGLPDRIETSIAAQAALMRLSEAETATAATELGIEDLIHHDGSLELYESEAELAASQPGWDRRTAAGIRYEHVRSSRLAALQPGLSPRFVAGTFVPSWKSVSDPFEYASAIGERVRAAGATLIRSEVAAVTPSGAGAALRLADGTTHAAAAVVIAAGVWSRPLALALGDPVPLDTERGYNTTLPPGAFDLRRQLIFGGHGFVVAWLTTGIRIGGAVELGGLKLPPNFARADAMLKKTAAFLPGLRTEGGKQWMGFRPSLPDSLPVIGPSRASRHIVYAFGHGHLGLTQAAGTGRLVADLVAGAPPAIDIAPFRAQRF
ncbi:MAG TPA: FAD-binding oxidoreductase [Alphaproteobacteria bacterium]|nr:FAD-binding oxidoreductase [Alphaproteobacteria bacterium]